MRKATWLGVFVVVCLVAQQAQAVSQWSRKYGVSCTTCHSAFPRLNPFGEDFMQNGFQMAGTQDGDEEGKMAIDDRLALSELVDIFGIRLNVTPVDFKTNARKEADGSVSDKIDFGNPNWLQFFVAGTVYKNVSIFIEMEVTEEDVHVSWYTLGFHNLAGMGGYANVRVGRLSALEWHALSGRLRQIPPLKNQVISAYKTSAGKGDDSVAIAAAYPAIEYYGYTERLVWSLGVQNGSHGTDPNGDKNYFGTVKVYLAKTGDFEGSSVSVAGMYGTDTGIIETPDATDPTVVASRAEAQNDFWRASPAVNIRYKDTTDLQVGWFTGSDDNWALAAGDGESVDFNAVSAVLGHWLSEMYWVAAQYDVIDSDEDGQDYEKVTATAYVFPRDNLRAGIIGRLDLNDVGEDVHEVYVNIRTMF